MDKIVIGRRIAEARRRSGLGRKVTQAELAARLGVTPQAVSGWERGEAMPESDKLTAISGYLNVGVGWLLEGDGTLGPDSSRPGISFVKLVDKVPAGQLAAPASQVPLEGLPTMIFADLGRGDFIALTVEGDSMDRVSPDGSVIVINRSDRTLVTGKPYVFCHKGRVTYKLWRHDPPRLQPFSTNPVHDPVYVKSKAEADKLVVGRVVRTVFNF